MPIALKDIKGLMIPFEEPCDHWQKNRTLKMSSVQECFNEALRLQGSKKIGLNRERLARELFMMFDHDRFDKRGAYKVWEELPEDCASKCHMRNCADALIKEEESILEVNG